MFRWGVVGTGTIVKKFIKGLEAVDDAYVYAVASRDIDRAKAFAEEYNIENAFGSYEQMAEHDDIDCIYIGVPHAVHAEVMKLFISKGHNVLCEKPFTINARETKEIIALAKKENVFVMEAMWTKYLPAVKELKEKLDSGIIGEITDIKADFGFYTDTDINNRLYRLDLGGGALLDVGVYPISFAVYLMGCLPETVESEAVIGETGVDEINHMKLVFDRNNVKTTARLASALKENQGDTAVITGTKGSVRIPAFFQADNIYIYNNEGELIEHIYRPHLSNGYEYEAAEVQKCICECKIESNSHTLQDTLDIMKLVDDMRKEWGLVYPADIEN